MLVPRLPFLALAGAASLGTAVAGLEVRVASAGGVPRLHVNGQPVSGRMFWGAPGRSALPVTPAGGEVAFEFDALEDEPTTATLHLRCGQKPGDVYLDDVRVQDLDTGKDVLPTCSFAAGAAAFAKDWTFWPTGEANTVGTVAVEPGVGVGGSEGLHVRLRAPAKPPWPDFHLYTQPRLALVRGHRYRVTFWARAEPARDLALAFYRPGQSFVFLGGPPGCFEPQIRLAAEAGVDFVSFPMPMPWPAPGQPEDWNGVDASCRMVLRANPKALLLPRMGMEPPTWWRQAHPEHVMVWEDGSKPEGAVVGSPLYRREAAARLAALVRHVEATFGDHVAGYHPCGQHTGEWFYQKTWTPLLNGYAPADAEAWRAWLGEHYADDAALRTAWGAAGVSRGTAPVPTAAARHAAPNGLLRDPARERALVDFAQFQQDAMAECVAILAKAAREASAGRKLVVFFYGYGFEFGAIGNGAATSGHYGLRRLLDSPDIDVLCSPISYFDRARGGGAPAMSAAESVALAGKVWLCEDDTATHLSSGDFPGWRERVETLVDTNALLRRNLAQEACRNQASWWMDLGATGWFNDPGMWAEMRRFQVVDDALLRTPQPYRPEVALVLDELSMSLTAGGSSVVTQPGVYEVRGALGRMGAPYGQYLLDDVTAGRVQAKLYVFANAWRLSAAQRQALREAVRGRLAVWCYAPGYVDGDRVSVEAMQELTGFRLTSAAAAQATATPSAAGRAAGLTANWGPAAGVKPLFAVADAAASEGLATYPDGSCAAALRRADAGVSLFVGAPGLTPDLLRLAARAAGVHLFAEQNCHVYANGPFVALHAAADGPLAVNTGRPGPVADALTGEVLGNGPTVNLSLRKGETRVLRVQGP